MENKSTYERLIEAQEIIQTLRQVIKEQETEIYEKQQKIDKAIEITNQLLINSADNRLIAKKEEFEYFDWLDEILTKQLNILKGEE